MRRLSFSAEVKESKSLWSKCRDVIDLKVITVQKQLQIDEGNEATPSGRATAASSSGPPWKTPAPVFAEPKTPATAVAASGWQELCCEEGLSLVLRHAAYF